jgi:beta-aspartyl-dipeptidase (metallo-type)
MTRKAIDAAPTLTMFFVIEGGEVFDPSPLGNTSILIAGDRVARVGAVDRRALDKLGVESEVIDATDCVVTPGFIDPHAHLLGGSGEGSLAMQTPMMFVHEIARAGVTTVVGTLGVDTTMKTMAGLLARVKALKELGLTTRMWSGGYNVPPTTVMGSVREDMLFIDEVVGAGEIAISDERALNQSPREVAEVVRDTYVGGMLAGKAGLTHFHVGDEDERLQPLRDIIDQFHVKCQWLYPTHVQRNERLLKEAIELAHGGAQVDMDVVNQDLGRWVPRYIDDGGPLEQLTISSDMDSSTPDIFHQELCKLVVKSGFSLDLVLPLVTTNTARVLKLEKKGRIATGCDGDVVIMSRDTLEVRTVIAGGKVLVRDGVPEVHEKWLEKGKRNFVMKGDEAPEVADARR